MAWNVRILMHTTALYVLRMYVMLEVLLENAKQENDERKKKVTNTNVALKAHIF